MTTLATMPAEKIIPDINAGDSPNDIEEETMEEDQEQQRILGEEVKTVVGDEAVVVVDEVVVVVEEKEEKNQDENPVVIVEQEDAGVETVVEDEQVFTGPNGAPLPSMREDVGPEGHGFEIPPGLLERKRSKQGSAHNMVRSSTFNRPGPDRPSIQSISSMPDRTGSTKSKKPPTFGKVFRSSPVVSLPKDTSKDGGISKEKRKEAKELAKFAIKALDMKDTDIAVKRLREALVALGQ